MDGGSRARRVLTNSAVLAVSKILERASGFVVGVLIANQLGADGLGVYAAAWALYGVIAVAGVAGTPEYLVREIGRDRACTASYTVHLSILALAFASVLMAATQLVARHVGYSRELEASISIMLLAILPKVFNGIQEGVFVAYGRVVYQTMTRRDTSGSRPGCWRTEPGCPALSEPSCSWSTPWRSCTSCSSTARSSA
jgi:O-antigen/teichoic acid export membrane protein